MLLLLLAYIRLYHFYALSSKNDVEKPLEFPVICLFNFIFHLNDN